jgi:ATP-dependent protease ClpP protease subunit
VFDGVAIYNLIRAQGVPVDVMVDGVAASAASVIAMVGNTRTMGKGAMMMVHNPWSIAIGDAAEMRKMADSLDKVAESISDIYIARTGKSKDDMRAMLDAETWLSADEAVEHGFATATAESDPRALAAARNFPMLAKLKNVPNALRERVVVPTSEAAPQGPPAENVTVLRERFKLNHKRRA